MQQPPVERQHPLQNQLDWFIRLRWIAGLAVFVGALIDYNYLRWYPQSVHVGVIGLIILAYNAAMIPVLRIVERRGQVKRHLLVIAWAQLLLDLGCLTVLALLTGGLRSPVLGFFVFHMVIASLLLPRLMAYAGASIAMLFLAGGLWITGSWPVQPQDRASMIGWMATLLITIYLANHLVRSLRSHRRRLLRQNRRIRRMSRMLRRQQRAMVQQEKMAALGQMAAGVAHEIANPLASMDGLLQLMQRRPERFKPESLGTLREQVDRIHQIVRHMTAFAHPGEGQWQTLPLNEVVSKALDVVRFDPRAKPVCIDRQLAADLPPVRMIGQAVQQVVVNLVINALDAVADAPEPCLKIRTHRAGPWCCIDVVDNGHGIKPEHRRHIFEPFFTTKPVGKGTGLGLSISYSIIRNHGGDITVESHPGQGTRFTVRLRGEDATVSAAAAAS